MRGVPVQPERLAGDVGHQTPISSFQLHREQPKLLLFLDQAVVQGLTVGARYFDLHDKLGNGNPGGLIQDALHFQVQDGLTPKCRVQLLRKIPADRFVIEVIVSLLPSIQFGCASQLGIVPVAEPAKLGRDQLEALA